MHIHARFVLGFGSPLDRKFLKTGFRRNFQVDLFHIVMQKEIWEKDVCFFAFTNNFGQRGQRLFQ